MTNQPCEQCGRYDFVTLGDDGLFCKECREDADKYIPTVNDTAWGINIAHELQGGLTDPSY